MILHNPGCASVVLILLVIQLEVQVRLRLSKWAYLLGRLRIISRTELTRENVFASWLNRPNDAPSYGMPWSEPVTC